MSDQRHEVSTEGPAGRRGGNPRSLWLDWDGLDRCLKRLGTCELLPAPDQSLLLHIEGARGEVEYPGLKPLVRPVQGGIFGGSPGLYEIIDRSDLVNAVHEVGAYGFASIWEVPSRKIEEFVRVVGKRRWFSFEDNLSSPSRSSPLHGSILGGEPFWEVSTWLEGRVLGDGREETYLVVTHSGVAPTLAQFLDSLGVEGDD